MTAIAQEIGLTPNLRDSFVVRVKASFPELVTKRKLNNQGRFVWVMSESEKQNVLQTLGHTIPSESESTQVANLQPLKESWEEKSAENLRQRGYVAIRTDRKGIPDVLAFRKRADGGFDLAFREAKGPGDSLSKEQCHFIEELKSYGIDAAVEWF